MKNGAGEIPESQGNGRQRDSNIQGLIEAEEETRRIGE